MRIQGKEKMLSSGNLEGKVNYKKERKREVNRRIKSTTEKDSEYVD
jgi:hypothetical protein